MNKRIKKKRELEIKVKYLESMLNCAIHEIIRQDKAIGDMQQVNSRNVQATNSRFDYLGSDKMEKVATLQLLE